MKRLSRKAGCQAAPPRPAASRLRGARTCRPITDNPSTAEVPHVNKGQTAVVTGGGSGIGRAIAHRLAEDGFAVAVLDLNTEAAERVAEEASQKGNRAVAFGGVDVSDRAQVDAAMQRIRETLGPVLVLVNNAGLTGFKEFMKITDESWNRIIAVNLNGPFYCTQAVVPDMVAAGWGRIVNISSSSAHSGQPFMTHYVASKAGVMGFTKALALELGPSGITVNTIPPGFVDTPMLRRNEQKGRFGQGIEHHVERTPVRRAGLPEDIAAACAFLVSEEAGYVTGQVFGVNGGRNT
nr:3-oxoacyl-ACP reductase FabG [Micromonospora sp. DSM 115978]